MTYSIIIPVHNESNYLPKLLSALKTFSKNNEIIIIDDGSNDNSHNLLKDCNFIKLIRLEKNLGKGFAIRKGMEIAKNENILITDGDLELDPLELKNLMRIKDDETSQTIIGTRYKTINPFHSILNFGNYFFTGLFNFLYNSNITDALCCAKAFKKTSINLKLLKSNGFDIDIELLIQLKKSGSQFFEIPLSYNRRKSNEGKKLKLSDGLVILKRLINT